MREIGFIGTGIMGAAMAGHLMDAGYSLRVYNRSKEKAQQLIDRGAQWRESPADCVRDAEACITIIGTPRDVETVYLGRDGLIEAAKPGAYLIDMTTSSPRLAQHIFEAAKARGVSSIDAPVSGGDAGAKNATLSIMAGGMDEAFSACLPLFECMGKTVTLAGGPGAGQHTKMANQIAIAGTIAGVTEAIVYAKTMGLAPETVLQCISGGAAGSFQLSALGPKMIQDDFAPGFYIKHYLKDMGIALDEADQHKLTLEVLRQVEGMYRELRARGMEDLGTQALIQYYE